MIFYSAVGRGYLIGLIHLYSVIKIVVFVRIILHVII